MKKLLLLGCVAFAMTLTSCVATSVTPVAATSIPVGEKVSKVSQTCYLGIICNNKDTGILTACQKGGIEEVSTVDVKYKRVLGGVITQKTIIVSGR